MTNGVNGRRRGAPDVARTSAGRGRGNVCALYGSGRASAKPRGGGTQEVPSAGFARNPRGLNAQGAEVAERSLSGKQEVRKQQHAAGAAPPAGGAPKKGPARCTRRRTRQCSLAATLTCVSEAGLRWGRHAQKVHTAGLARNPSSPSRDRPGRPGAPHALTPIARRNLASGHGLRATRSRNLVRKTRSCETVAQRNPNAA